MADRESQVIARIAPGVTALDAGAWDMLAGYSDPFVSHAFLSALEQSGSVGEGTGWTPAPILVEDAGEALAAVAPAYLKTHSQGEYVFDHGWADAFGQAGGHYYRNCRSPFRSRRCRAGGCSGSGPSHSLPRWKPW
jgi:uncharacterized protein